MRPEPTLVDIDVANRESAPCCGIKNPAHEGRVQKVCWMDKYLAKGARAKVLLRPDGRQCGYIEYIPGRFTWRAVNADGYLVIHCVWTFYKDMQHRGFANRMVQAAVDDARKMDMYGVAVVTRAGPWLAGSQLFLKNGFSVVDTAPPDYELLVWKNRLEAPNPSFRGGWDRKLKRYGQGLTLIRTGQCPHAVKFAREIAEAAQRDYGIEPKVVDLKSHRQAQNAPTPYAVFAIIHEGRLLADHPISETRFHNIMRKLGIRRNSS